MGDATARRILYLIQLLFIGIAVFQLDAPFTGVHFERQNQTFDIARHIFDDGARSVFFPVASFSLWDHPERPFTIARLEFPFHGVLGQPIAALLGRERAAVRLVSLLFATLSICLVFNILRHWIAPAPALLGAVLWAAAPLTLHFGQVPMPDIVCTAGVLAAFYLALRGSLFGSSVCFLFAVLAKSSVVPFGLPVLAALLLAKNCRGVRPVVVTTILWGVLPATGLAGWLLLDFWSPPTPWTLFGTVGDSRGGIKELFGPSLYVKTVGCLLPSGVGVLGVLGLGMSIVYRNSGAPMWPPVLRWSASFACFFYFVFVLGKINEPQYYLPLIVWVVLAAALGFAKFSSAPRSKLMRAAVVLAACAHIPVATLMAIDLKSSRVPGIAEIADAGQLLPPDARVIVAYHHYGAGPAVWLQRNVIAMSPADEDPAATVTALARAGFTHLMILDLESRYSSPGASLSERWRQLLQVFSRAATTRPAALSSFTVQSPVRRYSDEHFATIAESQHLVLYSLGR